MTLFLPRNELPFLKKAHEDAIFVVTDHACILTWLLKPLLFPYLFMASELTDTTSKPSGTLLDSRQACSMSGIIDQICLVSLKAGHFCVHAD